MECSEIQSKLSDFEEKSLSESEAVVIEEHLNRCAVCMKAKQQLNAVWRLLDELPVEEPDPFAAKRFMAKLGVQGAKRDLSRVLAAAMMLFVFGAGWFFHGVIPNRSTTTAAVQSSDAIASVGSTSFDSSVNGADVSFGSIDAPVAEDVFDTK